MKTPIFSFCVLIIFQFLFFSNASAQKGGYLDKVNYITIDGIYSPIVYGEYGVEYQRVLSANLAIGGGLRILRKNDWTDNYNTIPFFDPIFRPNGNQSEDIWRFDNRGYIVGVKLVLSSPLTGMQLPLGSSFAFGLDYIRNNYDMTQQVGTIFEHETDSASYQHRGILLKLVYGKSIYLFNNITLDASVELGIKSGRVKNVEEDGETPRALLPYRGFLMRGNPYSYTDATEFYLGYALIPRIKIGYIF